ncbi:CpsD/CapB family tyrosine-protein kinase [Halobacillus yeomjeoni]|uniref:CpsD/CapB family tyrosine-protein kinase n=1 Tax=Halobacillus yeomjeoni TaxID=311194 RepID=UPI001CD2B636|nr:CpsD/CapB family tyrosine-protein kinase [Halobacillus yeomjeoni]MCA0985137.1 CpsD/CapB family tyrosine-protein kinase [Halobacillus yeomjeoni]
MLSRRAKRLVDSKARTLVTLIQPRSPISEQYRSIRTDIQIASEDREIQTMVVTSAGPAEGKSMTVSNLSITFAQQGKKVLLIDADLRRPTLHHTFRLDNPIGLSNVLEGSHRGSKQHYIKQSGIEGLDLLPSGTIPENPSELLASQAMKKLLGVCKKHYDLIMIDTAPLLAVTDAQVLATMCDGALLVTRSKKTSVENVQKAVELLKSCKLNYFGAVLNDVNEKGSDHYYYYGS